MLDLKKICMSNKFLLTKTLYFSIKAKLVLKKVFDIKQIAIRSILYTNFERIILYLDITSQKIYHKMFFIFLI